MSHLCVFLNTKIENSGILAWTGNTSLASFRYLFNGRTVQIFQNDPQKDPEIHHVDSFHKRGRSNMSKTNMWLESKSTGLVKTILAIIFIVPGLIIGSAFKALSYLFADVRKNHRYTIEHFTPINRHIGSIYKPITTEEELRDAVYEEFKNDPKNRPTTALIIHGDGNLKINKESGILRFNPMKIILEGAEMVHEPSVLPRLDDSLSPIKWKVNVIREISSKADVNKPAAKVNVISSIEDALKDVAPRRGWFTSKRWHMLYTVPKPASAAAA